MGNRTKARRHRVGKIYGMRLEAEKEQWRSWAMVKYVRREECSDETDRWSVHM